MFFILTTMFVACKNEDFTVVEAGSGPAIKKGDWVFFTLTILGDTTVLQQNSNESMLPTVQIPMSEKEITDNKVIKALSLSKVGDSIMISIPKDSFPEGNPALDGIKMIHYQIRIKNAMDSVAYKSYVDKKMLEMQAMAQARTSVDVDAIQKQIEKTIADVKASAVEVKQTATGLKYYINEQGSGKLPKIGQTVVADYYGCLMDGKNFDKSFGKPTPFEFAVGKGNVIPGWDEAFLLFPVGTKATIFIPSNLGYGPQGAGESIPPNADLVFYVEVKDAH